MHVIRKVNQTLAINNYYLKAYIFVARRGSLQILMKFLNFKIVILKKFTAIG